MSPPRRARSLPAAAAAAAFLLAGAWVAAAALLLRTSVPEGIDLPRVDEGTLFTARELERAEEYEGFGRWTFAGSQALLLTVLALYAWRGTRFARESAAGPIGTGMLLGMLGLALVWLSQVPFRLADLWWARRHGLMEVGYVEALLGDWLALGGEFLFVCLALLIVMLLARLLGGRWWIAAAPAFVGLAALFAFSFPYLLDTRRLDDPGLRAEARRLAAAQRVDDVPVRVEEVEALTSAPNAVAAGLGPSRTVILWDTFLDGRFTDREIAVVLGHEFAHVSREHLPKGLAWYALLAFPGTYLIARATRRRGGMARPEAVPLSLLVLVALGLAAAPLEGAISRRFETEADWVALQTTRDPAAARSLFRKFTRVALSDPTPPLLPDRLLASHPSVLDRIRLVEAWARRAGSSQRPVPAGSSSAGPVR